MQFRVTYTISRSNGADVLESEPVPHILMSFINTSTYIYYFHRKGPKMGSGMAYERRFLQFRTVLWPLTFERTQPNFNGHETAWMRNFWPSFTTLWRKSSAAIVFERKNRATREHIWPWNIVKDICCLLFTDLQQFLNTTTTFINIYGQT